MRKITRVDIFANIDDVMKFWEWAAKQPPEKKTRKDMEQLLAEYKKADMYINAHPERVEHVICRDMKAARIEIKKKGENQ